MIDGSIFCLGGGPSFPAEGFVEDVGVFAAIELGFGGFLDFEGIEVFKEEEPGGLLGVIELCGAAGFLAEDIIDISEGLFEHSNALQRRTVSEPLRCVRRG